MTITLYTFLYNEEHILPYFLKHYSQYVNKIVVYNNQSTDNSIQILNDWKECEIEIREFNTDNHYDEQTLMDLKNNCWKGDDSDYVIVCDMDELLYHPNLGEFIKKQGLVDYFTPTGYHMIGEEIPTDYTKQIYEIIKNGTPDNQYNKNVLFKRSNITETNYSPGAHRSKFNGTTNLINCEDQDLKLLHYKWLSPEYVADKHIHYGERRSQDSINKGWGLHYGLTRDKILNDFNKLKEQSTVIL
jgi:glycosyltransferase involved in cell wall biosynthesis